jgi:hypothetical protein
VSCCVTAELRPGELAIARGANIDSGASQPMNDVFWRRTAELEAEGRGSETAAADCAREPAASGDA